MTDIVERLRGWNRDSYPHNWEAADEIERLHELFRIDGEQHTAYVKTILHDQDTRLAAYKAEIECLRAALEEIAGIAENNTVLLPDKVAEFARRALEHKP